LDLIIEKEVGDGGDELIVGEDGLGEEDYFDDGV
jgi:hypothetical protein